MTLPFSSNTPNGVSMLSKIEYQSIAQGLIMMIESAGTAHEKELLKERLFEVQMKISELAA